MLATQPLMDHFALLGGGERIQNCQNEDEALDVSWSCAKLRDKISVIWELKPIEPRKQGVGFRMRRSTSIDVENENARVPMRLVCVIDVSHSMSEPYGPDETLSKLERMKLFAQLLVRALSEEDFLGIVTFGTHADVVFPLTRMSEHEKNAAVTAIESIALGGVTNIGAGLLTGVEQFKTIFAKNQLHNDNILLFTDGMANEGFTDSDELIREIQKKKQLVRQECRYPEDYSIKIATLGTGGFLPELIYDISQTFSSDAFYFLDENTNMELNLIKPVLLRQAAMVSNVHVSLAAVNGVTLDRQEMTNEYELLEPEGNNNNNVGVISDTQANYLIHDIAADMTRHLVCYVQLPAKHKKVLKNKDVLTLEVKFRDSNLQMRSQEYKVAYSSIPKHENKTDETNLITACEHEVRITAKKGLDRAANFMKKLDRARAKRSVQLAAEAIRTLCEYIAPLAYISEETQDNFTHQVEPVLANLEYSEKFIVDLAVRWDDVWARLKAMSSCLGREVPTADGVFVEGTEPFQPKQVDDRMDNLAALLRDIYASKGLSTETIDNYRTVMKELQDKLEKLACEDMDSDAEENYRETRI